MRLLLRKLEEVLLWPGTMIYLTCVETVNRKFVEQRLELFIDQQQLQKNRSMKIGYIAYTMDTYILAVLIRDRV